PGVYISGPENRIGGPIAEARNVISGNRSDGVVITSNGNVLEGNFVGTDVTGTLALSNGQDGVSVSGGASNSIGGMTAGARNVISGNNRDGIVIRSGNGNLVQGNYIGTDVKGKNPLGNGAHGVHIDVATANNTIGGTATGAGNLISGNRLIGVRLAS